MSEEKAKPSARKKAVTKAEKVEVETVKTATPKPKKSQVVEKTTPVAEKAKVRKLDKNDDIVVMNNTTGRYGYISRSGFAIEMNEYGDTVTIPFGELQTMRSSQKRHIEDAFIIILDEDAVRELRYEKLYESILDEYGVEEILQDHERLDKMLGKMPATMRETIGSVAIQKFKSGELYDGRVKKVIEDNLKIKIEG